MTIIGIVVFIAGWIYAVGEFGFFLGLSLGWIPSFFLAKLIDWVLIAILGLSLAVFTGSRKSSKKRDY